MTDKIEIANWWLARGFWLLPCQPGKKQLLQGFGQYQRKLHTTEEVRQFFSGELNRLNMAVLVYPGATILDFDNPDLYLEWARQCPEAATTYTERTPRGGAHVFLYCSVPKGFTPREGVEIKSVCLVAPSQVDGKAYTRGEGTIIEADSESVFFHLAKPGTPTVHLLKTREIERQARQQKAAAQIGTESPIERIKRKISCIDVLQEFAPGIEIKQSTGSFVICRCPFHKAGQEKKESFWINTDSGLFGCHTCNIHGDVINLYAALLRITIYEAVRALSAKAAL